MGFRGCTWGSFPANQNVQMVDFASVITLALVRMDSVVHYVKIEHVRFIVKMEESAPCQEINANVEMVSMDLGATKGYAKRMYLS